jgi:hypothetical protein
MKHSLKVKRQIGTGRVRLAEMNERDQRFFGDYFDIHGCIHPAQRRDYHVPEVSLEKTNDMPRKIWDKYGSEFCQRKGTRSNIWEITRDANKLVFLKRIEPYLHIRRPRAAIAIEMLNILLDRPSWRIDKDTMKELNDSAAQMRSLIHCQRY